MIMTVPKIGTGSDENNPFRPDTSLESWVVIEEKESEFVIEDLEIYS